jgi:uncharacterized protein YcbX
MLDVDPTSVGPWFEGKAHCGYRYPDEINTWFSTAIETPVILVHSSNDKKNWKQLNAKKHVHMKEGDTRKTFTTDAALHIVNKASVDELRQRVLDNHPEGLQDFWVEAEQFRSNIVIDTKEGFSEDLYAEMRIGSCLLRNVGPTIRCNAIRTNYDNKV